MIEENYVHDTVREAVTLNTVRDSEISENVIVDNDLYGFSLLRGATGNVIEENTVIRNPGGDMYYDESSTPNIWEENCFETSWGTDIGEPECDGEENERGGGAALPLPPGAAMTFLRGDANIDGSVDVSDPLYTLDFLFLGGSKPGCEDAADGNDDGEIDISDALYTLASLFTGGTAMPPPYPQAGPDPTQDALGCEVRIHDPQERDCREFYCVPSYDRG